MSLNIEVYRNQRCERCNQKVKTHTDLSVDDAGDEFVIMGNCPKEGFGLGLVFGVPKSHAILKNPPLEVPKPEHFTHEGPNIKPALDHDEIYTGDSTLTWVPNEDSYIIAPNGEKASFSDIVELVKYLPKLRALFKLTSE